MHRIEDRLTEVSKRITNAAHEYGRRPGEVTLLAVSKRQTAEKIAAAVSLGLKDFGENYLQEALEKQTELKNLNICWHFIGPIQSNKTRAIANHFDWVHTVDRIKIAERLHAQREREEPMQVCIQVNIDNEESKSGVLPEEAFELARAISGLPKLQLRGLMVIPEVKTDFGQQRLAFQKTRELLVKINAKLGLSLDTLSMGMSADLEAAIAEGATIVRIGTAIFGERPTS